MTEDILAEFGIKIGNPWLSFLIDGLLVVSLYFLTIFVLRFIKNKFLARERRFKHHEIANEIVLAIYRLSKKLILLSALVLIVDDLPVLLKYHLLFNKILYGIGVIIVSSALFKLTDLIVASIFINREHDVTTLLSRIIKIILSTIGAVIVLKHFNYDIWHLVTALGIGSLAVGLAAQPTLTSIIAGFNLLIDRPFQHGDRVRLASGETGDVLYIGLRSTKIKTSDGNMLIVPNSELVNSRVINYSLPNRGMTGSIFFQFEQKTDFTYVKNILSAAISSVPGLTQEPKVLLSAIQNGAVELKIVCSVENFELLDQVRDNIIDECLKTLNAHGISLATPPPPITIN